MVAESHEEREKTRGVHWSSIFLGAFVCIALQILLTALGSAIGLSIFTVEGGQGSAEKMTIGAGIYAFVTVALAFFVGGYASSCLSNALLRPVALFHGLGVWAVVVTATVLYLGAGAASSFGGLLSKAGVSTAAAASAQVFMDELKKLNPRIVTDIHLKEGLLVTRVVTGPASEPESVASSVKKEAKKTGHEIAETVKKPQNKAGIQAAEESIRQVAAGVSWGAFGFLAVGAIAATLGGVVSFKI